MVQSGILFKFVGTSWAPELIQSSTTTDISHQIQLQDWQQRAPCGKDLSSSEGPPGEKEPCDIFIQRDHMSDGTESSLLFQIVECC